MRSDVVYRLRCCGHEVCVKGTPAGDEAYAEAEALRCLSKLCKCSRPADSVEKTSRNPVIYGYCLAPIRTIPLVTNQSQV
jgi:hypothetical protein